jgi:peptidyl-prolyl cis-trans isomerase SurA
MKSLPALVVPLMLLLPARSAGQFTPQDVAPVDRVVAIVGDSVVLESQITERLLDLQTQQVPLPEDPAELEALRTELLDQLVNELLVVQAALRDTTIVVADDQVEDAVQQDIDQRVNSLGGQDALQAALDAQGLTMQTFREVLRNQTRKQILSRQFMTKQQRTIRVVPVTESEIREFYEANRAQLGQRPATVTFRQVVIEPTPSEEADSTALAKADSLLGLLLVEGEDFEELAKRVSDDPGSRQLGGDLGWFRRGSGFVREFEDAAFALFSGQVSNPVRTQFGYHLIKVDRVRGAERKARHILISFDMGPEDVERTRALADSLLARARAGESLEEIGETYHSESVPDSLTVTMDRVSTLPPAYVGALGNGSPGQFFGPFDIASGPQTLVGILEIVDVRVAGEYRFEDLEADIRQRLQQDKILQQLMDDLRARSYVEIVM